MQLNEIKADLRTLSIIFLLGLFTGCAGNKKAVSEGQDYTVFFEAGKQAFEKKKWIKALDKFELVILNRPGSDIADDAQYYMGECHFNKKDYLLAISEYETLTRRYAYSPLVEKAEYKIALSYVKLSPKYQLEQEYTHRALRYLQDFIDTYPGSEYIDAAEKHIEALRTKLGRKLYESGHLYKKMRRWRAAIIYFDEMLTSYYDTKWALDAKLGKAYCLIQLREFDKYQELLAEIEIDTKQADREKALQNLAATYQNELQEIEKEQEESRRRF